MSWYYPCNCNKRILNWKLRLLRTEKQSQFIHMKIH